MIKILFFIDNLSGGGAEKVLIDLVNAMDKSRFGITVQTLYPDKNASRLGSGIKYKCCYKSAGIFNRYRMRLETALGLTYRFHIKDDYDIECAYLECGATKIIAGSTNKKAKKLAWLHCDIRHRDWDLDSFVNKNAKWYKKFDRVVCVSETVKKSFIESFGNVAQADVLYNVVNDTDIIEKSGDPLPNDAVKRKFTAVLVGRMNTQKRIGRLLRAQRKLLDEGFDFDVWIVGEGPERQKLEAEIKALSLEDHAFLFGFRKNPYPFMKAADLLVCSSIYEGFSTFITEGLIHGKPILTTDVSGMRELLGDSEYGLIVPNDDDAFYEGLKRMLSEQGLLEFCRERSSERGKSFAEDKLVKHNEVFFEGLLKN